MSDWHTWGDGGVIQQTDTLQPSTTNVSGPVAGAAVKGAWHEVITSVDHDSCGMILTCHSSHSGRRLLVDIGFGAAGSEFVVVPDIQVPNIDAAQFYYTQGLSAFVPLSIPAGTRVAARCQGQTSTTTNAVEVQIYPIAMGMNGMAGFERATAYGVDGANTNGTIIDPGGTPNSKGSFTELVGSTANQIKWMMVNVCLEDLNYPQAGRWHLDIATGLASSEQVVVPGLHFFCDDIPDMLVPGWVGPFPCAIPAGTRLSARCQSSMSASADRKIGVSIIGFD